jgi:hypothetical protein
LESSIDTFQERWEDKIEWWRLCHYICYHLHTSEGFELILLDFSHYNLFRLRLVLMEAVVVMLAKMLVDKSDQGGDLELGPVRQN